MDTFYSNKNINVLKNIIQNDLNNKYKIQNIQNYNQTLAEAMNYVKKNVSPHPPSHMNVKDYLYLLNKKVYDLVIPIYAKQTQTLQRNSISPTTNTSQTIKKEVQNESKKIQNNLFDADILRNYNNNDEIIDYPKPSSSNNINVSNHYEKIQEERSLMYPKATEVKFELDTSDDKTHNVTESYNQLLNTYTNQIENTTQFEETQKQLNTTIDHIADKIEETNIQHSNIQKLTPISQLKEMPTDTIENFQNFLSTHKNEIKKDNDQIKVEYNNNDLKKPIGSDNISFSDVNIPNNNIMLKEPNYNQILKTDSIIVSSRNRNLELFPNQSEFIVKFAPNDNTFIFSAYKDENDVLLIREKKVVIGNYSENDIGETFDNIKHIKCKAVCVPTHSFEYIGVIDNETVSDDFGLTLFKDSYLLLQIPELRGPYRGGTKQVKNALVQLRVDHGNNLQNLTLSSNFSNLIVSDEIMEYDPVTLGKLDKFTLQLNNKNGRLYNFGIDKLYVKNFTKGELKYLGPCGKKTYSTKFEIERVNDEYTKYCGTYYSIENCNTINDNPLNIRDLVYFYKTIPNEDEIVLFEKNIKIDTIVQESETIKIQLSYTLDGTKIIVDVERMFKDFMSSQDKLTDFYVIFIENGKKFAFQIIKIDEYDIYIKKYSNFPSFPDYSAVLVGITKGNKAGIYDENINSLFNFNGYNVISVKNTKDTKNGLGKFIVEVDYPWDSLPFAFQNNLFTNNDIFFIQDKKQISYVFSMTYHIKDYNQLDSYLNESGNN